MNGDLPAPVPRPAETGPPQIIGAGGPAPLEQISSAELAELRRRADKYRFLFRTIVTVTSLLVVSALIVTLVAIVIGE